MVADFLRRRAGGALRLPPAQVAAMCGWLPGHAPGAPDLAAGLAGLGFASRRVAAGPGGLPAVAAFLGGSLALVPTAAGGRVHWAVAHRAAGPRLAVADPWLGDVEAGEDDLAGGLRAGGGDALLVARDQQGEDVEVRPFAHGGAPDAEEDALVGEALDLVEAAFAPGCGPDPSWVRPYAREAADWRLSRAVVAGGRLAGAYLLRESSIADGVAEEPGGTAGDLSKFEGLSGVEGVALVVAPGMRGRGYGRLLRSLPSELGFDYVYGKQLKSLGNLPHWLRHRELAAETAHCWVTAAVLRPPRPREPSPGRLPAGRAPCGP
jgi:hypothetical protein